MNGILLIDKPSGITSSGCVYRLRKLLKNKKIGHCGTLDPLASGLLPICIGEATKFSSYISEQRKEYRVKILLGIETDSGDITGKKISEVNFNVPLKDIKNVLDKSKGMQTQLPPMYSALKFKGRPLYSWIRKGIYLKREKRRISINRIDLISRDSANIFTLLVSCSKGTYIRSLTESIGKKLGTKATVLELRRTKIGMIGEGNLFKLENSSLDSCKKALINCDSILKHIPLIMLTSAEAKKFRNGQQVDYNARQEKEGIVRIYEEDSSFIGLGSIDSSLKISPKRLMSTAKTQDDLHND